MISGKERIVDLQGKFPPFRSVLMIKLYSYKGCDSCKKAIKWLEQRGQAFDVLPIRETPPSKKELRMMLEVYEGNLKKLFNTSGKDYREQKLGDRLSAMNVDEAFSLLRDNGNLVKRPFLVNENRGMVGFNEDAYALFFDTV